jgi:Na+-translocating ferredoxin:NAD+ oxidoreductase RnfG subunit
MVKFFNFVMAVLAVVSVVLLAGCSTTSKSTLSGDVQEQPWNGRVFVTQQQLPGNIKFKAIGTVEVKARAGYAGVETLYPQLAEEAKKIGANAVVDAQGGRSVTMFSWSAPYVSGTAVKVENQETLKEVTGNYY